MRATAPPEPGRRPLRIPGRSAALVGVLRPKGNLSRIDLWVLAGVAALPIVSAALRMLTFPGVLDSDFGGIHDVGNALNQVFSLNSIPADVRDHVLYLLFIPTSALLVTIVRLTLGIRVLGFRSILISVGFHQSGLTSSLLLIAVAVSTIALVRPWLKRTRLPYYARISVILCLVSMTMVAALLAAPGLRSDVVWGAGFFPVIVLGMLAEGIAHTLDRQNVVEASWRALTTILLALAIAIIGWLPPVQSLLLQFPELVITQIVAIVLVAEYLDLKLLQGWDRRLAEALMPKLVAKKGGFRVALVRNRIEPGVRGSEARAMRRPDALRSVQKIVNALRRSDYTVKVLEGDTTLLRELRKFLPVDARSGARNGIVLNLAQGVRGEARTSQVPAMLEMSGIPYIGPAPLGHALTFDRVVARTLLEEAGIPTPGGRVMTEPSSDLGDLHFPLIIHARRDPTGAPWIVRKPARLRSVMKEVLRGHPDGALVEEHVAGRRISAALIGNDPVKCMPLVEVDAKAHKKVCPARLDDVLTRRIRKYARKAYRVLNCRDYARIELRVDDTGKVWVLGVGTLGILAGGGAFVRAARAGGLPYRRLMRRLVEVARRRARADGSLPPTSERLPSPHSRDAVQATPGLRRTRPPYRIAPRASSPETSRSVEQRPPAPA
jgi:D-alanine-D-alanine ligase